MGELLGKGNFSKVFKGLYQGEMCAVKKCEVSDKGLLKYIKDELAILRRANHPNIIQLYGAAIPPKKKNKDYVIIGMVYRFTFLN